MRGALRHPILSLFFSLLDWVQLPKWGELRGFVHDFNIVKKVLWIDCCLSMCVYSVVNYLL